MKLFSSILMIFFCGAFCCLADDYTYVNGPIFPTIGNSITLKPPDRAVALVADILRGKSPTGGYKDFYDKTMPDWVVLLDHEAGQPVSVYSALITNNTGKEEDTHCDFVCEDVSNNPDKLPYIKNFNFVYVFLIIKNDLLPKDYKSSTKLKDDIDMSQDIYVTVSSLKQYTSNADKLFGTAAAALFKVGPATDTSTDIYQPQRLVFLKTEGDYHFALLRVAINSNSLDRLTLHFPDTLVFPGASDVGNDGKGGQSEMDIKTKVVPRKDGKNGGAVVDLTLHVEPKNDEEKKPDDKNPQTKEMPSMVTTTFGAYDSSRFGVSLGFGTTFLPWKTANSFFTSGDPLKHLQSSEVNILVHCYPFEGQNPFKSNNVGGSFNLFCGTPIAGTSTSTFGIVYIGLGFSRLWDPILSAQDVGLGVGYGWDFTKARAPSLLLNLIDYKL